MYIKTLFFAPTPIKHILTAMRTLKNLWHHQQLIAF